MSDEQPDPLDELGIKRARKVMEREGLEGLLTLWQTDELALDAWVSRASRKAREACGDFDRPCNEEGQA